MLIQLSWQSERSLSSNPHPEQGIWSQMICLSEGVRLFFGSRATSWEQVEKGIVMAGTGSWSSNKETGDAKPTPTVSSSWTLKLPDLISLETCSNFVLLLVLHFDLIFSHPINYEVKYWASISKGLWRKLRLSDSTIPHHLYQDVLVLKSDYSNHYSFFSQK